MKTMKKQTQKFRSIDQAKLKILCDDLCDHIEELLAYFDIDYRSNDKMISMSCPIHGGDNMGAINLYVQGDTYRGNWKCRTHGCEKIFKGSIIGFIRGILSHNQHGWVQNGDDVVSFNDTINFVTQFLQKNLKDIHISKTEREKQKFSATINHLKNTGSAIQNPVSRSIIRANLIIPSQYYIDRGYSKAILDKYDVGFCDKIGKEMYNRVVVPIYDQDHKYMVGCTGRSIFDKCGDCQSFHDPEQSCPLSHEKYLHSKWKHSLNFKSQNNLYNMWYAKEYIKKLGYVILVESPGNVWRLEEANIHNSVAIFGSSLSDRQKIILDSSGAMSIVILTDNDEAGKKAADQIDSKCQNTYRIIRPLITKNDIGEMSTDDIKKEIQPILDKII
jgi:5S rRNA maturation endonuclease (ribonuclease M5)